MATTGRYGAALARSSTADANSPRSSSRRRMSAIKARERSTRLWWSAGLLLSSISRNTANHAARRWRSSSRAGVALLALSDATSAARSPASSPLVASFP